MPQGARTFGVELEPLAILQLERFLDLLVTWNRRFRLTGDRDPTVLARKHVVDSFAPVPHLPAEGAVVDIGSGGGFPGLVLGCVRPDLDLVLIESRRRPASFLAETIRTLGLRARVDARRAEEVGRDPALAARAAVAVARALRLERFLALAAPLLAPGGRAIAMQTPGTGVSGAVQAAAGLDLELVDVHDYHLLGGEARRLLIFERARARGLLS